MVAWFGFAHLGFPLALRAIWVRLYHRIVTLSEDDQAVVQVHWSRVSGPVGTLIATMASVGWKLGKPEVWEAPNGHKYIYDPGSSVCMFRQVVFAQVSLLPWKRAATHYCGEGLQDGIASKASFAAYSGSAQHQGAFSCLVTGGFWCPARLLDASSG